MASVDSFPPPSPLNKESLMAATAADNDHFDCRLPQLNAFWAHVAAFGALWGSLEITVGSFLHSLRFPFSGVIMASLGVTLLIAARQIMPRRGVSLATGIIAALCKSISPGGIILGPMVGITLEATLVEIALLALPQARASAILAGSLCALLAAFQKLIAQTIYYGSGIFTLYLSALRRARNWLGLYPTAGWWALAIALGIILALGISAGLIGHSIGRQVLRRLSHTHPSLTHGR